MDRIAVVITCDLPEDGTTLPTVEQIIAYLGEFIPQAGAPRAWLGVRESAEAIMKVTGETDG